METFLTVTKETLLAASSLSTTLLYTRLKSHIIRYGRADRRPFCGSYLVVDFGVQFSFVPNELLMLNTQAFSSYDSIGITFFTLKLSARELLQHLWPMTQLQTSSIKCFSTDIFRVITKLWSRHYGLVNKVAPSLADELEQAQVNKQRRILLICGRKYKYNLTSMNNVVQTEQTFLFWCTHLVSSNELGLLYTENQWNK